MNHEESDLPEVFVQPLKYEVTCVPGEHSFAVFVEYRGPDSWAVVRHRQCLNREGGWEWESLTSSRPEDFIARCRFPFEEALELARRFAPTALVNGITVERALRMGLGVGQ
jgi:hypothetical protein